MMKLIRKIFGLTHSDDDAEQKNKVAASTKSLNEPMSGDRGELEREWARTRSVELRLKLLEAEARTLTRAKGR